MVRYFAEKRLLQLKVVTVVFIFVRINFNVEEAVEFI